MRSLLAVAALGAVVSAASPSGWATPSELHWLTRVGSLDHRLAASVDAGATGAAARCSSDLRSSVGPPPTRRLGRAASSLRAACRAFARWAATPRDLDLLTTAFEWLYRGEEAAVVGAHRPLPVAAGASPTSHTDPALDRAARAVAGKRVTVRCWSAYDWNALVAETHALRLTSDVSQLEGFAVVGSDEVDISATTCEALGLIELGAFRSGREPDAVVAGEALDTLAHESEHARGVENEAQTECYAIQRIPLVARVLGLPAPVARRLTRTVWRDYRFEAPGYRSPACRDGGPWDLHPRTSTWP